MKTVMAVAMALMIALSLSGCRDDARTELARAEIVPDAPVYTVRDTVVDAAVDAAGVAEAFAEASLSTKLMGSVEAVLVREGDAVVAGQPLVRIDARDLRAKRAQVDASISEAEAMQREASRQAERMRALYADSAAPKAQLDAAETGLARADAALRGAQAGARELQAVEDYATIRAPFDGVVTGRFVDEGAFAAPGTPLVKVQDSRRLRLVVTASPDAVRRLRPGDVLQARIEDDTASAMVEGVVPAPGGNIYRVNALVRNADGRFLPGSAATLALRQGERSAILVPSAAIVREGDLTGVRLQTAAGAELRWVRLGREQGSSVEVVSGLRAGDRVLLPATAAEGA